MDSRVTKNYILLKIVKKLKIPYKLKESLYLLVIILRDPISYKNKVIYIKTENAIYNLYLYRHPI